MTNDFYELKWLRSLVERVIIDKFSNDPDIIEHVYKYLYINTANSSAFISCFSRKPDSLSQWRAYADDGRGVSIGVDIQLFDIPFCFPSWGSPTRMLGFAPVIYNVNFLLHLIEDIIKQIKLKKYEFNECYTLHQTLQVLSYSVKKDAFIDEDEWRFILPYYIDNFHRTGSSRFEFGYRASSMSFSKYAKLKIPKSSIKEVIIGPKNASLPHHLKDFLQKNSFDNVHVHGSQASYR